MEFQLADIEKEMLQRIFGEGTSPDRISLAEKDPDDDKTIYLRELNSPIKTILVYEYHVPIASEFYSVVIIEYKGVGLLLADFELVSGITIILGLSAVLSAEFIQNRLFDWWHNDNYSPPTTFSIEDQRVSSSDFIRRLFDNDIRQDVMTDDEFEVWLEENLNKE
jgi:hypothetical protein